MSGLISEVSGFNWKIIDLSLSLFAISPLSSFGERVFDLVRLLYYLEPRN
jgi:hypothetical protein